MHWFAFCLQIQPVNLTCKPETHRANRWISEAFVETQARLGTNLFGLFSCVGSFWNRVDSICSDSTCEVWERWLLAVWAIGFSDWLCASESVRCVGGAEFCVRRWTLWCALCFSMHSVPSFPVFMFWCTGTRLAATDVKEAYCISRKRRTYMLLCNWQP